MLLKRNLLILSSILFFVSLSSAFKGLLHNHDEEEHKETSPLFLGYRPRIISIFSKPPKDDAPKQPGPTGILGHVGNVIHGGSIGVEIRPLAGVQGIISHAKKIIPGGKPVVGKPEHQKPPPEEPYDPPKGGDWEKDEEEKDWVPENPEKPVSDGPSWDNIGEDPEDDPSIPYEEIINPRVKPRPKRHYINSRIYHVPVKFVSNAKPFQLRFNSIEKYRSTEKSLNGI